MAKQSENGYGIASLVLAILSALTIVLFPLAFILSIFALSYADKQNKIHPNGLATAGKIIGYVVLIITSIFVLILVIAFILSFISPLLQ